MRQHYDWAKQMESGPPSLKTKEGAKCYDLFRPPGGEWKEPMADLNKQDVVSGLVISEEVIAAIALNAAKDVDGISGFAARPRDLQTLLHVGDDTLRSVRVWVNENEIKLHMYLMLKGGTKIPVVSAQVQRAVKNAVQNMTGRVVTRVNISIVGVDFSEVTEAQK